METNNADFIKDRWGDHDPDLMALLDASQDPAVTLTHNGMIHYWNAAATEAYGYNAQEMVGKNFADIFSTEYIPQADRLLRRLNRGEHLELIESAHKAKDGQFLEVAISGSAIRDTSGNIRGALVFIRNLTDTHRNARELEQLQENANARLVVLEAASRVALDILASRTGVEALRHIADAARTLAKAQYAALGVAQPDGQGLLEFVTVGIPPEEEALIGPHPRGIGILGLLLHRNKPLRITNLGEHPNSVGFPPNHPPMGSFLGVPIRRDNTILGSLYLTNKIDGDHFTEADEIAVAALGAHAAVAIHNLQMLQRQRALLSGLINAQEEERRAIAYDLHDGLTQYVMASHMHLDAFRKAHDSGNTAKADRDFQRGMQYLKEAVVESRRLVNGLRSLALDDLGLSGALEQLFTEEKARAGWEDAELAHNIADRRFDKSLETAVYRVVQEALTNIRKHAQTDRVRVLLLLSPDDKPGTREITLEIRDWGRGFSPEERIADTSHVGLQGMAERISLIGGRYTIESAPGEGCCIHAVIPIIDTTHTSNIPFAPIEVVDIQP